MNLSKLQGKIEAIRQNQPNKKVKRWPPEVKDAVRELKQQGYSLAALSNAIGIAQQTIYTWVKGK